MRGDRLGTNRWVAAGLGLAAAIGVAEFLSWRGGGGGGGGPAAAAPPRAGAGGGGGFAVWGRGCPAPPARRGPGGAAPHPR
ncbi:hypothetical protein [Nocardia wallacei]|uniref:hypothetical protein n=1 Tax=Nocardia wallacei TaxID=480035 RepID=UPI0024567403|nr:hypothetical protein [Nocardia wallacei]